MATASCVVAIFLAVGGQNLGDAIERWRVGGQNLGEVRGWSVNAQYSVCDPRFGCFRPFANTRCASVYLSRVISASRNKCQPFFSANPAKNPVLGPVFLFMEHPLIRKKCFCFVKFVAGRSWNRILTGVMSVVHPHGDCGWLLVSTI